MQRAPRASVERNAPGAPAPAARPGDFILTHGNDWSSALIRFGQGLRYLGADRRFTRWNHAALLVDGGVTIVEATGDGVVARPLADYAGTEYYLVRIVATDEDRAEAAEFARACIDQPYGYLSIVSIAICLLTGARLSFGFDGQQICSGLVARALERTTTIFKSDPSHIMPADLAKVFGVEPPAHGTPRGIPPRSAR